MGLSIKKEHLRQGSLGFLSGILIALSYLPSIIPSWTLPFCFFPLWFFFLKSSTEKQVFAVTWITQMTLSLCGFFWIEHTAQEFGHLPMGVSFLVLIGFAAVIHLHYPVAATLSKLLQRRLNLPPWTMIFFFILLLNLANYLGWMIFPWHLGYPWNWFPLEIFQTAEWVGMVGLDLFTLSLNGLLFLSVQVAIKRQHKPAIACLSLAIVSMAALHISGKYLKARASSQETKVLKVLVVQANIGNFEKFLAERVTNVRQKILDTYLTSTDEGLAQLSEKPDLILWPETAFPDEIALDGSNNLYFMQLQEKIRQWQIPLLTGTYSRKPNPRLSERTLPMNAVSLISKDAQPTHLIGKHVLLAFGEYFPGAEFFPILYEWVPAVSSFARGTGPETIHFNGINLGIQICYEGLFPWFSRELIKKNANILINVTNDSWYGPILQPFQHLEMTLSRAIETRRPLIRSTNTGITQTILADGTKLEASPLFSRWSTVYSVPYMVNPPSTLFVTLEPLWPLGLILIGIFGIFIFKRKFF